MIDIISFLEECERTRNLQYGVMIRSANNGKAYAHLDDATHRQKHWALDEAMSHKTNDLLGLFEIDMATGAMKQIMNRFEVIDYCDQRRKDEMTEAERKEDAECARIDDMIKERV